MRWLIWLLGRARFFPLLVVVLWLLVFLGVAAHWWSIHVSWWPMVVMSMGLVAAVKIWEIWRRDRWIREAPLPQFLKRKLRETYPALSGKDLDLVERGLRQFFMACNRSPRKFVAMPSKVVDTMWHEFILHTQVYARWCDLALGRFLHHTPAEALGAKSDRNDGLRRAWYWACRDESIHPRNPTRLPLLFALDTKLAIEGGFRYQPDCKDIDRKCDANGDGTFSYCATSFSDGSSSGDSGSFGGADSSSGDSGSDGGSDGGSCGGGCGGGD